ncbi:protein GLUTAMINE DUMPER 2-like [Curcuma longa]|uniref:protein GLUTAMINE DUMPER 2-like n=1 Tax=Curcuma longa TaxID=136217 RepID=UPI003D9EFFCA
MRTPAGFTADGDVDASASLLSSPPSSSAAAPGGLHSAWHSPVPYLFGGLAAMLGLIAFALLILSCSFWHLSSYLDTGEPDPDAADSGGDPSADHRKPDTADPALFAEERFLVIMPGDDAPTVLAIPISKPPSAASSVPSSAAAATDQDIRQPSS